MKQIAHEILFLPEKLVQEEIGRARRQQVKSLLRKIRDWWNYAMEGQSDYAKVDEHIREIRTKYASYRIF